MCDCPCDCPCDWSIESMISAVLSFITMVCIFAIYHDEVLMGKIGLSVYILSNLILFVIEFVIGLRIKHKERTEAEIKKLNVL